MKMTNYAGQDFRLGGEERIGELTKLWEGYRAEAKQVPEQITSELLDLAHQGSWLAGNMLHLQGVAWDDQVGGQNFTYQTATFHTTQPGQLELRYDGFSVDICEA